MSSRLSVSEPMSQHGKMQMTPRHKSKAKLVVIESFFGPINLMFVFQRLPPNDTLFNWAS
jgi:hypothetical protein